MSEEESSEGSLTNRLLARSGAGIHRRSTPDGGEVYSGPLASRALRAVGARAMTMDESVFVSEDFSASNPEDLALYAHERHHQHESGGDHDGHGHHDAEETAARSIERMVFHRALRGDDPTQVLNALRDSKTPTTLSEADAMILRSATNDGSRLPEASLAGALSGYDAMLAQGKSHEEIVRELCKFVMRSIMEMEEDEQFRTSDTTLF